MVNYVCQQGSALRSALGRWLGRTLTQKYMVVGVCSGIIFLLMAAYNESAWTVTCAEVHVFFSSIVTAVIFLYLLFYECCMINFVGHNLFDNVFFYLM